MNFRGIEKTAESKEIVELKDVEFGILLTPEEIKKSAGIAKKSKELSVMFQQVSVDLSIIELGVKKFDVPGMEVVFGLSTKEGGPVANIGLLVSWSVFSQYEAYATSFYHSERKLQGLGRTLWEVSLRLIQEIANQWGVDIVHKVYRRPSDGLSVEKWNKLFIPILERFNYTKKREDGYIWEKKYTPQK